MILDDMLKQAEAAFMAQSFNPEERAARAIEEYSAMLEADLAEIPDAEKERYTATFRAKLGAYFAASSHVMCWAITGRGNFPVARNEKRMRTMDKRMNEFYEWRERAKKAIKRASEPPAEHKERDAELTAIDEMINGVHVFADAEADRLKMEFDGKPDGETIAALKSRAFKWSPRNQCWQRVLTRNAYYAAKSILSKQECDAEIKVGLRSLEAKQAEAAHAPVEAPATREAISNPPSPVEAQEASVSPVPASADGQLEFGF